MAIPNVTITAVVASVAEGDTSPVIPVQSSDAGLFTVIGKFSLIRDAATNAWEALTKFGTSAAVTTTAAASSFLGSAQHMVMTGQSGRAPGIYRNGQPLAGGGTNAATGSLAIVSTDSVAFGSTIPMPVAMAGKYGRAILWPFVPTPAWIAVSYAIQNTPQRCIGRSVEVASGTNNRPPVAVPMLGTQPEGANADYNVVQRAYDPEGDTLTLTVPAQTTGGVTSVVSGLLRFRPDAGRQGTTIDDGYRLTDPQNRISDGIVSIAVTAPVATTPAPVNSILPVISGTAMVGQTLTVTDGTWTGSGPITYSRVWRRNSAAISPAQTGTTYVPVTADIGTTLTVQVTATNTGGPTVATSTGVVVVTNVPPPSAFQLGAQTHFSQGLSNINVFAQARAASLPITFIRDEMFWHRVEQVAGVYNSAEYDTYYNALRAQNFKLLLELFNVNPLYDGNLFPSSTTAQNAFAGYAAYLVNRYGAGLVAVELWNEPNGSFGYGYSSTALAPIYVALAQKVYAAVKAVRTDIPVLVGASVGFAINWHTSLINGGILPYCDGFSFHPYANPDTLDLSTFMQQLRTLIPSNKILWATEFGVNRHDSNGTPLNYYRKLCSIMAANGVGGMSNYLLQDTLPNFGTMGLLDSSGAIADQGNQIVELWNRMLSGGSVTRGVGSALVPNYVSNLGYQTAWIQTAPGTGTLAGQPLDTGTTHIPSLATGAFVETTQAAPTNLTQPSITPTTASVGQTLTCNDGTWTGSPTITRVWRRGTANTPISPAQTGTTYVTVAADVGQQITVAVTATNTGGSLTVGTNGVTPTDTVGPPPTSVLPTWNQQWLGASAPAVYPDIATPGTFNGIYAAALNNQTIRLAAGNYGLRTLNRAINIRLLSMAPPYTQVRSTPIPFNANLHKTSVTDTRASDYIFNGTVTPNNATNRVIMDPNMSTACGDVMLEGITIDETAGTWSPLAAWTRRLWIKRCTGRDQESIIWSGTGNSYSSMRNEVVHEECWLWSDGNRSAAGGTQGGGGNFYSDYGSTTHQVNALYFEGCVIEGGYNHFISLKADSGRTSNAGTGKGVFVNRCIFVPFGVGRTSNYTFIQCGQVCDEYNNSGTGDNTVGYTTVTNCTFMDQGGTQIPGNWVGVRLWNCEGMRVEGCVFWPAVDIALEIRRRGDFPASGTTGIGATAWSLKSYVKNNVFYRAHTFNSSRQGGQGDGADRESGRPGGVASNPAIEFEGNTLPNGGTMNFSNNVNALVTRIGGNASGFTVS